MEFKIDGQNVKATIGYDKVSIAKRLDALKDGELLSANALAEKLHVATGHLRDNIRRGMPDYFVMVNHKVLFGSKKTIKAYKAAINE